MNTPPIHRQHETTRIPELCGQVCSDFTAVFYSECQTYGYFYIRLAGVWHNFSLDAGLLFWREGIAPVPSDDLLEEGDEYIEIGDLMGVEGSSITEISMDDCQLSLQFDCGARLILRNEVEGVGSTVIEFIARE